VSSKSRVALVNNICPHYRRPLFELLARRFELECFFFASTESYWNPLLPSFEVGDFVEVELPRYRLLGEPVMPALASRLTRARYDAVVMGLAGRLMLPYVFATARARRLPFVLWTGTWHHPHPPSIGDEAVHRGLYRQSDAIVVYGEHVRRALLEVGGVDDAKIFTAGQAVEGSKFAPGGDATRSRTLLFVGQFEERKGISDLFAAFALIDDPNARLALIGNGTLEAEVRRLAAKDPRIEIVGHVPQDGLPAHYAEARALVLPSVTTNDFREPWGLVVNEAMHAGLPVITTDAVGAAAGGLVKDGTTGLVVPERNPRALSSAMSQLLSDDVLTGALATGARGGCRASRSTPWPTRSESAVDSGFDTVNRPRGALQLSELVLVTGGAGYIGASLQMNSSSGRRVRAFDDPHARPAWGSPTTSSGTASRVQQGDLLDAGARQRALDWRSRGGAPRRDRGRPRVRAGSGTRGAVNVDASRALVEDAATAGVERFVMASTCSNYGKMTTRPCQLTSRGLAPYRCTRQKVEVEQWLLGRSNGRLSPICLRFATASTGSLRGCAST
jgi:glycosyltransferase involved in cell wall biosynthesis